MVLYAGFWVFLRLPCLPACWAARKEGMNNELRSKIEVLAKEVLLNTKAQDEWIATADPDILNVMDVFAKRHIEKDKNTTKMDAFKMGFLLGAVYERRQREVK